jgi:hypothetical protein
MNKALRYILGTSPKTSAAGLGTVIAALLYAIMQHTDNDPSTVPDWETVVVAVGVYAAARCARDNTVTSEQAKKPE